MTSSRFAIASRWPPGSRKSSSAVLLISSQRDHPLVGAHGAAPDVLPGVADHAAHQVACGAGPIGFKHRRLEVRFRGDTGEERVDGRVDAVVGGDAFLRQPDEEVARRWRVIDAGMRQPSHAHGPRGLAAPLGLAAEPGAAPAGEAPPAGL